MASGAIFCNWEILVAMEKNIQRKRAVEENDVELLKSLEDATEWYKFVEPETGNTFLHIAVLEARSQYNYNRDVFHYLLRFIDFPLDHRNDDDRAVLELCWNSETLPTIICDELACELMLKGASLDCVPLKRKDTLLHQAAGRQFVKTSKFLLNMDYDVNARGPNGFTPLWYCLLGSYRSDPSVKQEMVGVLLWHGADPAIGLSPHDYNTFEYVVRSSELDCFMEEIFRSMFDEHSSMDIYLEILLILSCKKSHMFSEVVECSKNVIVGEKSLDSTCRLFLIDNDDLKLLLKKFPNAIKQLLKESVERGGRLTFNLRFNVFVNMETLLESKVKDYAIDFIQYHINKEGYLANKYPYFFLSHGIRLKIRDLIEFDQKNRLNKLLKFLQHMEIELPNSTSSTRSHPVLCFIYDLHADVEQILLHSDKYSLAGVGDLLDYFAHPKLRELCSRDERPEVVAKIASQPDVPLLMELARTAARKSLASKFTITNTSQFFKVVNRLPIPTALKKVLTFEKKLY